jgi:pyocin large subunit-like protein
MKHNKRISGAVAALLIALFTWGYDHYVTGKEQNLLPQQTIPTQVFETAPLDIAKVWTRGRQMSATENATQHFKKHGKEFGFKTEAEYVAAAIAFTTNPSADVMQNKQRDGDTAFYNPKSAEYAVKSKRGLIRTYFKLDPKIHGYQSNTDYFNAQASGQPKPPANDNQKR